jgi:hypothetical protein
MRILAFTIALFFIPIVASAQGVGDIPEWAEPRTMQGQEQAQEEYGRSAPQNPMAQNADCQNSNGCRCREDCNGNPQKVPLGGLWFLIFSGGLYGVYALSGPPRRSIVSLLSTKRQQ